MWPKPRRGDFAIERKRRRQAIEAHEHAEMTAALVRDGRRCRWPGCEFAKFSLPIDPCHFIKHRGMGGDPSGELTERKLVVSLCRRHHDALDKFGEIEIEALDKSRLADGPLLFFKRSESGRMEHVYTEPERGR